MYVLEDQNVHTHTLIFCIITISIFPFHIYLVCYVQPPIVLVATKTELTHAVALEDARAYCDKEQLHLYVITSLVCM